MSLARQMPILLGLIAVSLGLASCGSDSGDSTSADNAQDPSERVSGEAAPYRAARATNAELYRAAKADPETVAAFRKLIGAAADEIGAYWSQAVPKLYGVPYHGPDFVGGYDPAHGEQVTCGGVNNALKGNAFFCDQDNYIAWDEPTFMVPLFRKSMLAPVFVLAHEWGHSVQAQLGAQYAHSIDVELGADCLAGAWAVDAAQKGALTREDFDRAVEVLNSVQDTDGLPWTDSDAHGTAFERIRSFGDGTEGGPYRCISPADESGGKAQAQAQAGSG
jgi:predicted metalloprotease